MKKKNRDKLNSYTIFQTSELNTLAKKKKIVVEKKKKIKFLVSIQLSFNNDKFNLSKRSQSILYIYIDINF